MMIQQADLATTYRLTAVFTLKRALREECVAQLAAEFADSLALSAATMTICLDIRAKDRHGATSEGLTRVFDAFDRAELMTDTYRMDDLSVVRLQA